MDICVKDANCKAIFVNGLNEAGDAATGLAEPGDGRARASQSQRAVRFSRAAAHMNLQQL